MSVTLTNIETLTRNIVGENIKTDSDVFEYVTSSVFTLTEEYATDVSSVYVNGALLSSSDWSYDSDTQKVTITSSLSVGDSIEIYYTYYEKYSSTEVQGYIKAALTYISVYNYADFYEESGVIYPEPSFKDRNLITMVTAIILKPDNKSYRLPDMDVRAPEGSKPLQQMIKDLIVAYKQNSSGVFNLA